MLTVTDNISEIYELKALAFDGGRSSEYGDYFYSFYFTSKMPSFCKTLRCKS